MRIDPSGSIGGFPVLLVRRTVRGLNNLLLWDLATLQAIARVGPEEAGNFVEALEKAGLAKANRGRGPKTWTTTELAQSLGAATAAKPILHRTAERALADLLDRVYLVNRRSYFLAKVTKGVLFGLSSRSNSATAARICRRSLLPGLDWSVSMAWLVATNRTPKLASS